MRIRSFVSVMFLMPALVASFGLIPQCMVQAAEKDPAAPRPADAKPSPADLDFFEKKIRPVLVEQCYQCHSAKSAESNQLKGGLLVDSRAGLLKGGDSGAAVVPGDLDESLLLDALRYDSLKMPPKGKLPAAVIADFEAWIKQGAADPREGSVAVAIKPGLDIEGGRKYWSYQPLQKPAVPQVKDTSTASAGAKDPAPLTPIDAFILEKLQAKGLEPVPVADRATLVRRLYFDLIGLPPSPAEIDAFVSDPAPNAYERLVDRLLASPHYGERWGRHWLDIARFAESLTLRGFVLPEAWRYRDYVIASFNADRPFDQFIKEQVSGDLLPSSNMEERTRNLVATTFLVMGNTNLEEQDKKQLRMDVVDEQIDTIGKAFIAQTIACARCHDHKFDPIPTRDYYALAGILSSSKSLEHSNVSKWLEFPLPVEPEQDAVFKKHEAVVASLTAKIKTLKDAGKLIAGASAASKELQGIVVDDKQAKVVGEWKFSQYAKGYVGEGYVHDLNMGKGEKTITFLPKLPKAGKYEVRFAYSAGLNRCEAVPVTVFSADGDKTILVNEREAPPIDGRFISLGTFQFELNGQGFVIVSNEGTQGHVIVDAVQFLPVDMSAAPVAQAPATSTADASKTSGTPATTKADPAKADPVKPDAAKADPAKPDVSKPDVAKAAPAKPDPAAVKKNAEEIKALEKELKTLTETGPRRPMYMSVQEETQIADAHVHIRGTVHNLGERVPRGFLQVATYGPSQTLPVDQSGRKQLGEWLASRDNPLTPRVLANRVWHWLFGAGLCRTPDNFGTTGETPSHPELLNYLSARLLEENWSVKSLVREIVLSRAYRRDSISVAKNFAADPENRLLWHMNRRRLDAECLLDSILTVSGELTLDVGGKTLKPNLAADYGYKHDSTRRAVYWPVLRNSLPELFEVFDFADPSVVIGSRSVSTVSPQALFLMNNPWITDQSQRAAKKLLAEPNQDDATRLTRLFRTTLGRPPCEAESKLALRFLDSTAANGDVNPTLQTQRWSQMVQALLASLDFRYVD